MSNPLTEEEHAMYFLASLSLEEDLSSVAGAQELNEAKENVEIEALLGKFEVLAEEVKVFLAAKR